MKKLNELLRDEDPLRHETDISSSQRLHARQTILAAATASAPVGAKSGVRFGRLALVAVALLTILFIGSRILPRHIFETHASVLFEVRLAEETPAAGLLEVKVDGRTIYLHPDSVVSNDDIARTEVIPGNSPYRFSIGVNLTPEGARRMSAATAGHLGKRIAVLFDNEVVAAPVIRSVISDAAVISGNYTEQEAERIANGLR